MSDPNVPSCRGVGSIITLGHVSKANFDKINASCWMKSSLIPDEKFFHLVKVDEQLRGSFKCMLYESEKILVAFTTTSCTLTNHVKASNFAYFVRYRMITPVATYVFTYRKFAHS